MNRAPRRKAALAARTVRRAPTATALAPHPYRAGVPLDAPAHRPVQRGARFAANAAGPSCASAL